MYAVLGEDKSDVHSLREIIWLLEGNSSISVKPKGYCGCHEMFRKGKRHLGVLKALGYEKSVVCYDADGPDPTQRFRDALEKIIQPSGVLGDGNCCILIPVQELEASLNFQTL